MDRWWAPSALRLRVDGLELRLRGDDQLGRLAALAAGGCTTPRGCPFLFSWTDGEVFGPSGRGSRLRRVARGRHRAVAATGAPGPGRGPARGSRCSPSPSGRWGRHRRPPRRSPTTPLRRRVALPGLSGGQDHPRRAPGGNPPYCSRTASTQGAGRPVAGGGRGGHRGAADRLWSPRIAQRDGGRPMVAYNLITADTSVAQASRNGVNALAWRLFLRPTGAAAPRRRLHFAHSQVDNELPRRIVVTNPSVAAPRLCPPHSLR
ncbi:hypothetical protein SAMN05661080_04523 [Modestobacter sp. DSM 44400]|nr:hypothetical protein SAMN05661080_04523 [Modestobacter sp. DSM 44400]